MNNSDATQGVIALGRKTILIDAQPSGADAYVQWWTHGEWLDRVRFGLLRREWEHAALTRPSAGIPAGS